MSNDDYYFLRFQSFFFLCRLFGERIIGKRKEGTTNDSDNNNFVAKRSCTKKRSVLAMRLRMVENGQMGFFLLLARFLCAFFYRVQAIPI